MENIYSNLETIKHDLNNKLEKIKNELNDTNNIKIAQNKLLNLLAENSQYIAAGLLQYLTGNQIYGQISDYMAADQLANQRNGGKSKKRSKSKKRKYKKRSKSKKRSKTKKRKYKKDLNN